LDKDTIYTVTAGHIEHNKWRCWAWFATLEEAQQAVEGCKEFFCGEGERYYHCLVIEQVPRGAITPEYNEWWYQWDGDDWRPTTKPIKVETLFHFGVG
jgi:hypothetical protein